VQLTGQPALTNQIKKQKNTTGSPVGMGVGVSGEERGSGSFFGIVSASLVAARTIALQFGYLVMELEDEAPRCRR
jgi:hypothetical protein